MKGRHHIPRNLQEVKKIKSKTPPKSHRINTIKKRIKAIKEKYNTHSYFRIIKKYFNKIPLEEWKQTGFGKESLKEIIRLKKKFNPDTLIKSNLIIIIIDKIGITISEEIKALTKEMNSTEKKINKIKRNNPLKSNEYKKYILPYIEQKRSILLEIKQKELFKAFIYGKDKKTEELRKEIKRIKSNEFVERHL